MTAEEMLTGWLCIMRHQWSNDCRCIAPSSVREALMGRGWIRITKAYGNGTHDIELTAEGCKVSDLAAPEWWINPISHG